MASLECEPNDVTPSHHIHQLEPVQVNVKTHINWRASRKKSVLMLMFLYYSHLYPDTKTPTFKHSGQNKKRNGKISEGFQALLVPFLQCIWEKFTGT